MEIIATWTHDETHWRQVRREVSVRQEVPGAGHSGTDLVMERRTTLVFELKASTEPESAFREATPDELKAIGVCA